MNSELMYTNVKSKEIKITYAIPTYKRSQYIIDTIESIINQNVLIDDYEILIVNNDPSSDMSYLIDKYRKYPISVYRNKENIGMANNLNRCFQLAVGKYVSMIHDDDMLCPNFNTEIDDLLNEDYDVIIAKRFNLYNDNKRALRSQIKYYLFKWFSWDQLRVEFSEGDSFYAVMNIFLGPTCGTTFNKERFIDAGLFDLSYPYAFDFYTFQNLVCKGYKFTTTKDFVGIYRMEVSASNRSEVSLDFFDCNYDLLQKTKKESRDEDLVRYLKEYEKEILYLKYSRNDNETKRIIRNKYNTDFNCSKFKYLFLSIKRSIYYYKHRLNFETVYKKK